MTGIVVQHPAHNFLCLIVVPMGDAVEEFKLPEGIKDPAAEFDLHESLGKG